MVLIHELLKLVSLRIMFSLISFAFLLSSFSIIVTKVVLSVITSSADLWFTPIIRSISMSQILFRCFTTAGLSDISTRPVIAPLLSLTLPRFCLLPWYLKCLWSLLYSMWSLWLLCFACQIQLYMVSWLTHASPCFIKRFEMSSGLHFS